jgi:hypothetical protein
MSWKGDGQVLGVGCFDNSLRVAGGEPKIVGSDFALPEVVCFYYEGFSNRTDRRKLAVRVKAAGDPSRAVAVVVVLLKSRTHCLLREEVAI